jgi:hypothetical protein
MEIKKLIIFAVAGIAAITALIIVLVMFSPSQYSTFRGEMLPIQIENDRIVITTHRGQTVSLDGRLRDYQYSLDGRKIAFTVLDGDTTDLYHMSGNNLQRVASGVESIWFSASGNGIAFTQYDRGDTAARLLLWTGGSPVTISINVGIYENRVTLSPDGKTVGFVENDGENDFGMVFTNNRATELGRGLTPIGVADSAKYIYFTRVSAEGQVILMVQRGLNEERRDRLAGDLNMWEQVFFNKDMSQIIFTTRGSEGRSHISDRGRDSVPLRGVVSELIVPYNTAYFNGIVGVRNFKNTFYVNNQSALIHIDSKYETRNIQSNVYQVYLSSDGKTLTYNRGSRIERVNGTKANAEPVRLVDERMCCFVITANGNAVFYVDSGDIMYQKGSGRAVSIAHDFRGCISEYNLYKGDTLFFIQDRELYSSSGRSATRISGLNGDVTDMIASAFCVYIEIRDGSERLIYQSTNGRNFTEIK